jgi:transposase-like protein
VRQVKYLNNFVEQDHRAIQRRARSMLGFKEFRCARIFLAGLELMHGIRKRQMKNSGSEHPHSVSALWLHKQLQYIAL